MAWDIRKKADEAPTVTFIDDVLDVRFVSLTAQRLRCWTRSASPLSSPRGIGGRRQLDRSHHLRPSCFRCAESSHPASADSPRPASRLGITVHPTGEPDDGMQNRGSLVSEVWSFHDGTARCSNGDPCRTLRRGRIFKSLQRNWPLYRTTEDTGKGYLANLVCLNCSLLIAGLATT